tara:strand:- start:185 stop:1177 length:993 start_codon:yes stop_codon:yes gene_type:complete
MVIQVFKYLTILVMGYFYINIGVKHFTDPTWFLQIIPPYLPYHLELVYISGFFEIVLGVLLLFNKTRYIASYCIILLLICVFPANIYLAQTNGDAMGISPLIAWGRLPFQSILIVIAYWHSKIIINFNSNARVSSSLFWNNRYLDGNTKWDIGKSTPIVSDYLKNKQSSFGKVCVLGCGNGYDAMEFAKYNNDVYAVDFSEQAIKNLKKISIKNNLILNLINEDIFKLDCKYLDYFDLIFEYTCFCAIDPARRKEYFDLSYKILNDNGLLFGIFIPLDKETNDGPPFRVSIKEIEKLIQGKFKILDDFYSDLSIDKRKNREKVLILKKVV